MSTYYENREQAKNDIVKGLRDHLLSRFRGSPVIALRSQYDEVKVGNKEWVKEHLRSRDCEDLMVSWRVFYDFKDDSAGIPRITDFTIIVEGSSY